MIKLMYVKNEDHVDRGRPEGRDMTIKNEDDLDRGRPEG